MSTRGNPHYKAWANVKQRCCNPNHPRYEDYGGRGIGICDRWRDSFDAFYEDMGEKPSPKHSIERIDNNRGYEPDNCRWATSKDQQNNTRYNRFLTINGVSKSILDWSRETGVSYGTINGRRRRGLPDEECIRKRTM